MTSQRLLNTRQASIILNVAPQTLVNWRFNGTGPNYVKLSTRILYEPDELENFIQINRVEIRRPAQPDEGLLEK